MAHAQLLLTLNNIIRCLVTNIGVLTEFSLSLHISISVVAHTVILVPILLLVRVPVSSHHVHLLLLLESHLVSVESRVSITRLSLLLIVHLAILMVSELLVMLLMVVMASVPENIIVFVRQSIHVDIVIALSSVCAS